MDFVFGSFVLDLTRGEFRGPDGPIALEPRVFALLVHFLENPGRLIDRDELISSVWDGRIVSDSAISTAIKVARQALGDDGAEPTWLKTLRGRGFRFDGDVRLRASAETAPAPKTDAFTPPEPGRKPRIAVLPFANLGLEGQLVGLGDAMPAELITSLSRLRWLEVIARGSSFRFRGDMVETDALRDLLEAGYCLAGNVEASGSVLSAMVELSDTTTGAIIWADRFESPIDQLRQLRPRIVSSVISALDIHIPRHEAERAQLLDPGSLDAWSSYHLGLIHVYRFNGHDNAIAEDHFARAISLAPDFASAHAAMSFTKFQEVFLRLGPDRDEAIAEVRRHAERAIEIDPNDPQACFAMGRVSWLLGAPDEGTPWLRSALSNDPNYARAFYTRGAINMMSGRPREALEDVARSETLSPLDPLLSPLLAIRGLAQLQLGDTDGAIQSAEHAALTARAHHIAIYPALVANAVAGNHERALKWRDTILAKRPDATIADFFSGIPFRDDEFRHTIRNAITSTGLPTGD